MKKAFVSLLVVLSLSTSSIRSNYGSYSIEVSSENYNRNIQNQIKSTTPKESLFLALEYYGVKHPEIVFAQSKLETGNWTSHICKKYNNLFGLYDSKNHDYYKFNHWSESVIAYKEKVQYKYKDTKEDYYNFLQRIGYAEDSLYIEKVRLITNQEIKKRKRKQN